MVLTEQQTKECLNTLFIEAAADMAERERNEISIDVLSFLCEVAFDGVASQEDIRKLQHRIGSIAILEPPMNNTEGSEVVRAFPNEAIFNHFLAAAIIRDAVEARVPPFLRKLSIGLDLSEAFSNAVARSQRSDLAASVFKGLKDCLFAEARAARLTINLGTLLLTVAQHCEAEFEISDVQAENVRWSGLMPKMTLRNVEIGRMDARTCILSTVAFDNARISELIVNENTQFGISRPHVDSLHINSHSERRDILRTPDSIEQWLAKHSAETPDDSNSLALVRFFDSVIMYFIKHRIVNTATQNPRERFVFDENWDFIWEVLEENKLGQKVHKDAATRSQLFYRILSPTNLLAPPEGAVAKKIRHAVIEKARTLERTSR